MVSVSDEKSNKSSGSFERTNCSDNYYFEERDGTWIKTLSDKSNITHLKINSPLQTEFDCWYFGHFTDKYESELEDKLNMMLTDAVITNGMAVIGLDTEDGGRLIQFSSKHYAVLIHRSSGLMESACLKAFLANQNNQKVIFTGAAIAVDAISVRICGLYDLTPICSVLYPKYPHSVAEPLDDSEVLGACEDCIHSVSLKHMFEEKYKKLWVKEDPHNGFSWMHPDLSLTQLKYAALDAWVSHALGVDIVERFAPYGLFKYIFATTSLSEPLRFAFNEMYKLTDALWSLHSRNRMSVSSIKDIERVQSVLQLEATCSSRSIKDGHVVLFTVYHPQGSEKGVSIEGEVLDVVGQRALIKLHPLPANMRVSTNQYDTDLINALLKNPSSFIASIWQDGQLKYNPSQTSGTGRDSESMQSSRVFVGLVHKDEAIHPVIKNVISMVVRGHIVSNDLFPSVTEPTPLPLNDQPTSCEVAKRHNVESSLYILSRDPSLAGAVKTLPIDAYAQALTRLADERTLNPQQVRAVERALGHSISVVSGPSGTGKVISQLTASF